VPIQGFTLLFKLFVNTFRPNKKFNNNKPAALNEYWMNLRSCSAPEGGSTPGLY